MISSTSAQASPLSADNAAEHLVARGILPRTDDVRSSTLTGGVSGEVVLVESGDLRYVVKQALEQLRTARPWHADPDRILTEASALRVCATLTPAHVPTVVDVDPESRILTMTAAPAGWRDWRSALLEDPLDTEAESARIVVDPAAELGRLLASWHLGTQQDTEDPGPGTTASGRLVEFQDRTAFQALRVDPFHRCVLSVHQDVGSAIRSCIADLEATGRCLVHGDFSPKNVLLGADGLWVLDHEVAHAGAPVFDLAFLVSHLALKAMHRPAAAQRFREGCRAFVDAYRAANPDPTYTERLAWHTACLMLARVDGTSPAGYLRSETRDVVRTAARDVLGCPSDPGLEYLWDLVVRPAGSS